MLREAKCTSCGANVQVDPAQDAANCKYCGAAFIVEKAINNYNIANAQIHADTVNVNVGGGDFVIEGGVLKRYKGNAIEVTIPNSVRLIDYAAFEDCISLESVVIPSFVKTIGIHAFRNCANLRSITFLGNIECDTDMFIGCHSITEIKTNGEIKLGLSSANFKGERVRSNYSFDDLVFPKDIFPTNKTMACRWIVFLRGYDAFNPIHGSHNFIGAARRYEKKSFDKSPLYVNGENVIDKLVQIADKGVCYVATAVYGSYEAPQVRVLRRFRDDVLSQSVAGRIFIKVYYRLSPPIAQRLKHTRRLNAAVRHILDKLVAWLSRK